MDKKEIMEAIKELAKSQGFYCRLYETLKTHKDAPKLLDFLEKQHFKDMVDMVMFFEC